MSTSPQDDELRRLKDQLVEAAAREASFRLANAQEFLQLQSRVEAQVVTLGERDAYIHQMHLERIAAREVLRAAHADLEAFAWMLQDAEKARDRLHALVKSWIGKFVVPLRWLQKKARNSAPSANLPGAAFLYDLHTSPYRLYRETRFQLRGWAFPKDGRAVTAIRMRCDAQVFPGRYGIEEPEVVARFGLQSANPRPGFEIEFLTPPGRHWLRLEACLENRDWVSILNLPIWCQPEPDSGR